MGTFILVFGGCGIAVFACGFPEVGMGLLGVSLAFGLTVLCCAYALGPVSGCHLNPAVSIGLVAAGRFPAKDLPAYIAAQVIGGDFGSVHAPVSFERSTRWLRCGHGWSGSQWLW
jgi:aquaporin Z